MIKIALTNQSTVLTDLEVQRCLIALQTQLNRDFKKLWGTSANLVFQPKGNPLPAGYWQLVFADNSDQVGALGYHQLTANGDPIGFVFAKTDLDAGTSWTVTASHELMEMMGDPTINLTAEVDNPDGTIIFYAYELADACEDDSFGYNILVRDGIPVPQLGAMPVVVAKGGNVLMSDFLAPAYFENPKVPNKPLDLLGHITEPLQILKNGYMSVLRIPKGTGWEQVTASMTTANINMPKGSRRDRRRTPDSLWKNSTL